MRCKALAAALTCAISWLPGCRFASQEQPAERHERLVSLSKQYSEIIYALGAQQDLVGVDLSSTYPPELKAVPTVGYHRALSVEGLVAVKPTLILHDNNIGPEHVVRQLEQLKIPMKVFANKGADLASTQALITEMGAYFHKEARAAEVNAKLAADFAKALQPAADAGPEPRPKVMVIHFGQASNVYLVMTSAGTAGKMVEWAGGEMAVKPVGGKGMVQLSPEVVAAADPDVLLLTDFGYDKLGSPEQIKTGLPGISSTKAARSGRIFRVEEHDLVYFGPRTGENILKLQGLLRAAPPHAQ
jgi:iron complex transport system substrate-binding protein